MSIFNGLLVPTYGETRKILEIIPRSTFFWDPTQIVVGFILLFFILYNLKEFNTLSLRYTLSVFSILLQDGYDFEILVYDKKGSL